MKKLLATLCIFLLLPFVFAGCVDLSAQDEWVEVQSITYTTDAETTTLTSTITWDITDEFISKEEYDNAPEERKKLYSEIYPAQYYVYNISKDRQKDINNSNNLIGIYYSYWSDNNDISYLKYTYNSYEINYVKIKLNSDGSMEIDFNDKIKVFPTSYEITYFIN